jgi:hypothetical protein
VSPSTRRNPSRSAPLAPTTDATTRASDSHARCAASASPSFFMCLVAGFSPWVVFQRVFYLLNVAVRSHTQPTVRLSPQSSLPGQIDRIITRVNVLSVNMERRASTPDLTPYTAPSPARISRIRLRRDVRVSQRPDRERETQARIWRAMAIARPTTQRANAADHGARLRTGWPLPP